MIPDKEIAESCLVFINHLDDNTRGTGFSGMDLFDLSSFKTDETGVSGYRIQYCEMSCLCGIYPQSYIVTPMSFQRISYRETYFIWSDMFLLCI